jgi:hypothetical protein
LETHRERSARHGLPDRVGMQRKLIAQRRSDEVGTVRVEAFLNQQVDLAEIDDADVDRQLLRLARPLPGFKCAVFALHTIHPESIWSPIGAFSSFPALLHQEDHFARRTSAEPSGCLARAHETVTVDNIRTGASIRAHFSPATTHPADRGLLERASLSIIQQFSTRAARFADDIPGFASSLTCTEAVAAVLVDKLRRAIHRACSEKFRPWEPA